MTLIIKDDPKDPELVGTFEKKEDLTQVKDMVNTLNGWLVDSGYETYKYKVEVTGDQKAYIKREEI